MRHGLHWRTSECLAPYLPEIGHGVIAQMGGFGHANCAILGPPRTPHTQHPAAQTPRIGPLGALAGLFSGGLLRRFQVGVTGSRVEVVM